LTLPLRQLSARPSGGSHPRSGKAACGFILAAAVARTAAGADPRNSRAGPRPSHHMRLLSRPPPRPPHPSPSHYVTPCECVCEVIARSTRDSLGTCEVCARQRLAQEEHSSVPGCQPCHSFLGAVVTRRCGRVLCCVERYDASDCCAAVVNLRALRWPASLGHTSSSLGHTSGAVEGVVALG